MLGRQFIKRGDMPEFSRDDCGWHVSPWNAAMEDTPTMPQAVEPLARTQVRWMRQTFPNAACGGKLLLST